MLWDAIQINVESATATHLFRGRNASIQPDSCWPIKIFYWYGGRNASLDLKTELWIELSITNQKLLLSTARERPKIWIESGPILGRLWNESGPNDILNETDSGENLFISPLCGGEIFSSLSAGKNGCHIATDNKKKPWQCLERSILPGLAAPSLHLPLRCFMDSLSFIFWRMAP